MVREVGRDAQGGDGLTAIEVDPSRACQGKVLTKRERRQELISRNPATGN